jgi:hypothetical protein
MNGFLKGYLMFLLCLFSAGCGGGSTGTGNTVFFTSSLKTGTTGAVFANFSGVTFANSTSARFNPVQSANTMNFTLKSVVTSNSGGTIKNSDIDINRISFTYTPVNNPAFSVNPPTFIPTTPVVAYSGNLTPGGTLDIQNVPVLWDNDILQIGTNLGSATGVFQYIVGVTFSGTEVNTGIPVNNTITISAFVQKK